MYQSIAKGRPPQEQAIKRPAILAPIFRPLNLTPRIGSRFCVKLYAWQRNAPKRISCSATWSGSQHVMTPTANPRSMTSAPNQSAKIPDPTEREEQIRLRAYALYEARPRGWSRPRRLAPRRSGDYGHQHRGCRGLISTHVRTRLRRVHVATGRNNA